MNEAKGPVVRLKVTAKEFNFSKLRADQDNKLANSGETMFLDFQRMNFIINGKKIDKNFIIAFKEGAKHRKSELFNSDDIYSNEIFNDRETREIDTDDGKTFVDSILKGLEKELINDELVKLWNNHCENPEIADHQKTDSYKKNFEEFYNAGQNYIHLLPTEKDENKDYRPFAKEIFKQIFRYAGAEVPSDAILEELVTNCNQAGYEAAPFVQTQLALGQSFVLESPQKVINIDCVNQNSARIRSDMSIPVLSIRDQVMHGDKICDLSNSLEFTIESHNGESFVTYRDGKLSLTIPEELKSYKDNGKSLFDIIKEYFQKLCAKLGFKPETKIQIEHDLGTSVLGGAISTIGSDANKEFINFLEKNLKDELSKKDANEEDIDAYVEVKVPTVIDLLSKYVKLEDNKENRELLVKEVADNLGLSSQNYTFHGNGNPFALRSLPYLVKGQVNYEQAQFVANIFTKLIIEGKSEVYEKQGAINAINRKVDGKIIEQEEKTTNKQSIENDKWTDKIEKQKLSVKSHEHSL
ncbi:hypothetical protein HET73_02725 [Wolbachia endosymbiont of Atemnus politus]|uniref:hypothetical protein n=1 Tax=Wolbachia endosymbiont of Atemnus politus TaxID=2682840 RepID=UPI0015718368|nr:hypothetical protein [Wolbachia endosymbiont of Atemnus politus]NSM56477.1 hypothetical protein [Wolbachia endosymbiont of Atemnus politus]NSX83837.1 hypothetical protein [Wolbachia endosymbiont of Atemnus politus]